MDIRSLDRIQELVAERDAINAERRARHEAGLGRDSTLFFRRQRIGAQLDKLNYVPLVDERVKELETADGERAEKLREELRALGYTRMDRDA